MISTNNKHRAGAVNPRQGGKEMKLIRITSHWNNELVAEQLYFTDSQTTAIERFRKEYPEHGNCIVIAENYDSEKPENKEHFKACLRCGCVN